MWKVVMSLLCTTLQQCARGAQLNSVRRWQVVDNTTSYLSSSGIEPRIFSAGGGNGDYYVNLYFNIIKTKKYSFSHLFIDRHKHKKNLIKKL